LCSIVVGDNINSVSTGDASNRRACPGLEIRIVGVGRDGVVAAEEIVGEGLNGSASSRFRGRSVPRKSFLSFPRGRGPVGDFGAVGVGGGGGKYA